MRLNVSNILTIFTQVFNNNSTIACCFCIQECYVVCKMFFLTSFILDDQIMMCLKLVYHFQNQIDVAPVIVILVLHKRKKALWHTEW